MSRYVANPCELFWRHPEAWPKAIGTGHVFLAFVFQREGKGLFGDDWTGEEGFVHHALRPSDRALLPHERRALTLSPEWLGLSDVEKKAVLAGARERHHLETIASVKRCEAVRDEIVSAAASGELITAWRAIEGGEFKPIPRGLWNTERTTPRFLFGQMSLQDPFGTGVLGPEYGYIFLESSGALELIERQPFSETQPLHVGAARFDGFQQTHSILGSMAQSPAVKTDIKVGGAGLTAASLSTSSAPVPASRKSRKSAPNFTRALEAVHSLYGDEVPRQADKPNTIIVREVSVWLKANGKHDVSSETILRAAGRRK